MPTFDYKLFGTNDYGQWTIRVGATRLNDIIRLFLIVAIGGFQRGRRGAFLLGARISRSVHCGRRGDE